MTITLEGSMSTTDGTVTATIEATEDISSGNLKVRFAVVEDNKYAVGTNGEYRHRYAMRDMPDEYTLSTPFNNGEIREFSRTFPLDPIWDLDTISIVAFVQDDVDQDVLQAASYDYIPQTILVVDDDERTQHMLSSMLRLEGYRVITASSGDKALEQFNHESPDLILLDIMMPGINGYDLCQRIREFSQVPIIMLTAKDSEQDTIDGLDVGADDYVTKPFLSKELLARIRASLRRTRLWDERPSPPFQLGDLTVDFDNHRVQRDGKEIRLTATEYRLLSYLARNAGRVLTVDAILTVVWGERYYGDVHLLQSTMTNLRSKLGDNARNPQYILTRSGIGYMMKKEA